MNILNEDVKRLPVLLLGFFLLSLGMVLTLKAGLGMSPWGVFHLGLSEISGLSMGVVTQLLGLAILMLSVLLVKTKVGMGTLLNVLLIGFYIDFFIKVITYIPESIYNQWLLLFIGLVLMTFGRSLYISARLGAGPRDGLFVGLSSLFNIEVKYMKPIIEITVLIIGFFLGGTVGYGTIVLSLSSGYLVQLFFKLLRFNPKTDKQSGFENYFIHKPSKNTSN